MGSATTFALGGVTFAGLTNAKTAGKYALEFHAGAAAEDLHSYHPPNVEGSYTVSGGLVSRPITAKVRYVASSLSGLHSAIISDRGAFEGKTLSISGDDGQTYARSRLTGARRVSPIKATGRGTLRVDVEYSFVCYSI